MYSKNSKIFSGLSKIENYLEDTDVYNSKLLYTLSDPNLERVDYVILNYQYRPDLIAKDFYGEASYMGLLLLQTGMTLSLFYKGNILRLIPRHTLENILNSI